MSSGCVTARDLLQFKRTVIARIHADTTFCATKWHIYDSTFIRHQSGKRHHLILVNFFAKAYAAFARSFVMRMLDPVRFDNFNGAIVTADREISSDRQHYKPLFAQEHPIPTL
jgi:hypothetical protein